MSAREVLAGMRERAEAATEGPWHRDRTTHMGGYTISVRSPHVTVADGLLKRDAELIAHARTDLPALFELGEAVVSVLEDLVRAHPNPAPYTTEATVIDRLSAALTALEPR